VGSGDGYQSLGGVCRLSRRRPGDDEAKVRQDHQPLLPGRQDGQYLLGDELFCLQGGRLLPHHQLRQVTGTSRHQRQCHRSGSSDTAFHKTTTKEQREAIVKSFPLPLGAFGEAKDAAEVALFLASDAARIITGEIIDVNGGMFMD